MERAVVTREWNRHVLTVKNRLLGLGREMAPRLVGLGPMQIQAAIDNRIFEILRLLAHPEYCPIETLEEDLKQKEGDSFTPQGGKP